MQYIGSLLGRVFIFTPTQNLSYWEGHSDNLQSDYDQLGSVISYNDGDMTVFEKLGKQFYVFFSMSTNIEIFKKEGNLLVIDGYFLNELVGGTGDLKIERSEKLPFNVVVDGGWLTILDATLYGNELTNQHIEGVYKIGKEEFCSYGNTNLKHEIYNVYRIKIDVSEEIELFGVEIGL